MNFKIKQIILWPKNESLLPRIIKFDLGKVNVITGGNGKGKSSIINIVDYCLGSSRCSIASGIIRDKVKAYGIVISLTSREVLLAREEAGSHSVSNNFFKIEDDTISIPDLIIEYQFSINQIKQYLNSMIGFSDIGFSSNDYVQSFDTQKPSYRNAISLNLQPQYLVANQSTMFYKADSSSHREKLKILFPYLIGAINNRTLELKEELKDIKRRLNILVKDKELRNYRVDRINRELINYYRIGKEFGLIKNQQTLENIDQEYVLETLKATLSIEVENVRIPEQATEKATEKLYELSRLEIDLSDNLQDLGRRLSIVKSIQSGNIEIGNNSIVKKNRLSTLGWFNDRLNNNKACPLCGSTTDFTKEYFDTLSNLLSEFEKISEKVADSAKIYLGERRRLEKELGFKEIEINRVRDQINALKREDGEFNTLRQNQNSINRYLGQVELTLNQFSESTNNEETESLILELEERLSYIESLVSSDQLKKKERYAIGKISDNIKKYALIFEAEKSDENIILDINEFLTLKFLDKSGKEKFLWEVGSGHNHMAYHISTYLGIHEYLITIEESKVPSFIIFDQPSQAYFPEINDDNKVDEEDMLKLNKIFQVLSEFNTNTQGKVQLIILEHAGEESWKDFDNVLKVKRWRTGEDDNALIPDSWGN